MNPSSLIFRKAKEQDLAEIIKMLADDVLGQTRENEADFEAYRQAFLEISEDKNNFLAVVEFEKQVIATCHLTLLPSLTFHGSKRMNIEAVRVSKEFTNQKIGSWMLEQAITFAKDNQVKIIQLTTNKKRQDAQRFYQNFGFTASHEGMKLNLQ